MIAVYAGGVSGRGPPPVPVTIIVVDAFRASTTIAVLVWKGARVVPGGLHRRGRPRRDGLPHRGTGQLEGRGLRFRQLADGDSGLGDTPKLHRSPLDHEWDPHRGGRCPRAGHLYRGLRQRHSLADDLASGFDGARSRWSGVAGRGAAPPRTRLRPGRSSIGCALVDGFDGRARRVVERYLSRPAEALMNNSAARRLKRLGYERDLEFCLAEDTVPVVPRLVGDAFVGCDAGS